MDLTATEYLRQIDQGLPPPTPHPARVVVVGAGMAGLVAANQLTVAGHDDEFAGGAFALFAPGQQTLLHRAIVAPEGRIHFAGEHASLSRAWIQGAIESGLRAAGEVHAAARQDHGR